MNRANRVLVSTLPLAYGKGVATHTRYVADVLQREGFDVTLAWYEPYSMTPSLSVPFWRLGTRRARARAAVAGTVRAHQIGCWLPELEFTNYWPTRFWKDLISEHDVLLAVSGNALAALPFALSGRPYLAWLGTPFVPDRQERVKHFPFLRRMVDRFLNTRVCERYERLVLDSGTILPTSSYVAREFRRLAPDARLLDPAPVPVDISFFQPSGAPPEDFAVAFVGKYNDRRKNILFLLDVVRCCRDRGVPVVLNLYGDEPAPAVRRRIASLGLSHAVRGLRNVSREELRDVYRRSAVFVIPSLQEGLCVAALEAMACGCPVVTSPCGGPEDFVFDGVNGRVAPLRADAFADAILSCLGSNAGRARLSAEAQAAIRRRFTTAAIDPAFLAALDLIAGRPVRRSAPEFQM